MVSTLTVHDEPALNVVETATPEKVAAIIEESAVESTPETPPAADDVVERIDVDVPREEEPAEEIIVVDKVEDDAVVVVEEGIDMSSDDATDILHRYGFGAGMRMYARSLALAELEEKERAAKVAKVADMKAAKSALKTSARKKVVSKPTDGTKPFMVIPSIQSVIDFETVRSELSKVVQSIASLGSMDFQNKSAAKENDVNGDDVDDDVIEDGSSRSTTVPQNQGCCAGAEEALEEIFREAEAWADATYQKMSRSETKAKQTPTTHWWSSFIPQRKSSKEVSEPLQLDADSEKTSLTDNIKKWWSTLYCNPVILDEKK